MKIPEFVSNIDPFILPAVTLPDREKLPQISGLYFVLDSEKVLYIGRSIDIKTRWASQNHHRLKQLLNRKTESILIAWLKIDDADMLPVIEKEAIDRFSPLLNDSPVEGGKKSRRFYVADLSEYHKDTLKVEAFINGKAEGAIASELLTKALDDNEDVRLRILEYLAHKKGLTVAQLWKNIISSKEID